MNSLKHAKDYIMENRVDKSVLPAFHAAPPCGWINDPNGFSYYEGKIHLFCQLHPYDTVWGPMHWGHFVSDDFISWEEMQVVLAPEECYDYAGCFSGTAIETEKGHLLAYTGVIEKEIGGTITMLQNQCLAIGDGREYVKFEQNPVVTGELLPKEFSRNDFRDPKLWKEDDCYYMIAGNKTIDGMPQIVLLASLDLLNWKYVSVLAKDDEHKLGSMWECPDFFIMDGKYVLMFSPQDMEGNDELHNGHNSIYFIGDYDKTTHEFKRGDYYSFDDGLDFYAPQTMAFPDGRRIMIGWMQSWDSNIRPPKQKWACMMTIPRELSIVNGRIRQSPVREIEKYHSNQYICECCKVRGTINIPEISGRMLDLSIEITDGDYNEFTISFASNDKYHCDFIFYKYKNMIEMDRSHSGMIRDTIASRRVKIRYPHRNLRLRFILDRYSAEIFVNDGEQVLSTTFYTPLNAEDICFSCDKEAVMNIVKHELCFNLPGNKQGERNDE